jgi:hypothetical protein
MLRCRQRRHHPRASLAKRCQATRKPVRRIRQHRRQHIARRARQSVPDGRREHRSPRPSSALLGRAHQVALEAQRRQADAMANLNDPIPE